MSKRHVADLRKGQGRTWSIPKPLQRISKEETAKKRESLSRDHKSPAKRISSRDYSTMSTDLETQARGGRPQGSHWILHLGAEKNSEANSQMGLERLVRKRRSKIEGSSCTEHRKPLWAGVVPRTWLCLLHGPSLGATAVRPWPSQSQLPVLCSRALYWPWLVTKPRWLRRTFQLTFWMLDGMQSTEKKALGFCEGLSTCQCVRNNVQVFKYSSSHCWAHTCRCD